MYLVCVCVCVCLCVCVCVCVCETERGREKERQCRLWILWWSMWSVVSWADEVTGEVSPSTCHCQPVRPPPSFFLLPRSLLQSLNPFIFLSTLLSPSLLSCRVLFVLAHYLQGCSTLKCTRNIIFTDGISSKYVTAMSACGQM